MTVPCKNCEKIGCGSFHDECAKYQEFKRNSEKICEERMKNNVIEEDADKRMHRMRTVKSSNGVIKQHRRRS